MEEATLHGSHGDCMVKVIGLKGHFIESIHVGPEGFSLSLLNMDLGVRTST